MYTLKLTQRCLLISLRPSLCSAPVAGLHGLRPRHVATPQEPTSVGQERNPTLAKQEGDVNQILFSNFTYQTRRPRPVRVRKANEATTVAGLTLYQITRRGRFWEVRDATGDLVCLTAYKKGAKEVVRRLSAPQPVRAAGPS